MLNHYNVEDFSCEIDMPMQFLEFIRDFLNNKQNDDGTVTLGKTTAETFGWMLTTAGTVIYKMNEALYGDAAKREAIYSMNDNQMANQPAKDGHQIKKEFQLESLLKTMTRELDDFLENWSDDTQTVPQRFDDLITLVKSAKAVLNNGAME